MSEASMRADDAQHVLSEEDERVLVDLKSCLDKLLAVSTGYDEAIVFTSAMKLAGWATVSAFSDDPEVGVRMYNAAAQGYGRGVVSAARMLHHNGTLDDEKLDLLQDSIFPTEGSA